MNANGREWRRVAARRFRAGTVMIALITLTACGFQLRGSFGIDESLSPMRVVASGDLGRDLRDALRASGVELVDDAGAASTLRILEVDRERRVAALTEGGRVDAYELVLRVEWRLDGRASGSGDTRSELIAPNGISARRSYDFDPEAVLPRGEEEAVIDELLRDDIVTRMLFRIQAWSPGD